MVTIDFEKKKCHIRFWTILDDYYVLILDPGSSLKFQSSHRLVEFLVQFISKDGDRDQRKS